jgi:hypothetical protein
MQYITQLAFATARATPNHSAHSNRENNFTFYPGLLKSEEPGGSGWIRTIDPRLIKTVL